MEDEKPKAETEQPETDDQMETQQDKGLNEKLQTKKEAEKPETAGETEKTQTGGEEETSQTKDIVKTSQPGAFEHEMAIFKNAFLLKSETATPTRKKTPYHVALLLSLTLGWMGIDRFYLGKIGTGILKAVTSGGFGIWYVIDIFLLLLNKQRDVLGQELEGADEKDPIILAFLTLSGLYHYFYLGMYRFGVIRAVLWGITALTFVGGLFQVAAFFLIIIAIWSLFDIYLVVSGRFTHAADGTPIKSSPKKYQSIALLFSVFGGFIGMDRFYLGHRVHGLLKLVTIGGLGMWWLLDIVLIILNAMKDVDGKPLIQE